MRISVKLREAVGEFISNPENLVLISGAVEAISPSDDMERIIHEEPWFRSIMEHGNAVNDVQRMILSLWLKHSGDQELIRRKLEIFSLIPKPNRKKH